MRQIPDRREVSGGVFDATTGQWLTVATTPRSERWTATIEITGTIRTENGSTDHSLTVEVEASTKALLKERISNVMESSPL